MGLRITPGLYPTETGYSFADPITGAVLRGSGVDDLIERLRIFRVRNELPVGDPAADVTSYLCTQNPAICRSDTARTVRPTRSGPGLSTRVLAWLNRIVGIMRKPSTVSSAAAITRLNVCRGCVLNTRYDTGCATCAAARRIRTAAIARWRGLDTSGVAGCSHYGWDNAVACTYLPGEAPDASAPPGCWRGAT